MRSAISNAFKSAANVVESGGSCNSVSLKTYRAFHKEKILVWAQLEKDKKKYETAIDVLFEKPDQRQHYERVYKRLHIIVPLAGIAYAAYDTANNRFDNGGIAFIKMVFGGSVGLVLVHFAPYSLWALPLAAGVWGTSYYRKRRFWPQ